MPQHRLPAWTAHIAKAAALIAGVVLLSGFETQDRIDARSLKSLPKAFRLAVVAGAMTPSEAEFRRSGNTYVNEAPSTSGANLLSAGWFALHNTDSNAVVFEYPATNASGQTIYRLVYAVEEQRNRYRLYDLNEDRFVAALDALESSVRRDDASWKEREFYDQLTRIWNAHASRSGEKGGHFYVGSLDDLNTLIAYSRRLPDGSKIITSTGDMVELYVR